MSEHHENFENHENHEHQEATSTTQDESQHLTPSAPPAHDDNGYIVVPPTPQSSMDTAIDRVVDALAASKQQEEITRLLADLSHNTESSLKQDQSEKVVAAEADSSVREEPAAKPKEARKEEKDSNKRPSACPYYCLAMDYLTKVEIPPRVRELVLWTDPKVSGAVFGSLFALLLSLASFSLLTVVSSLLLTGLSVLGAYRFYLALMYRIKGTYDNTFDKLSQFDLSLPKDKIQTLAHLLETDVNRVLNKLKAILLWDNLTTSVLAFVVLYVVYCIGSMFNTLTLLILALVSLFTLPKVYQVYQKPIDQGIAKATDVAHNLVKQVQQKIPMLNKKKQQ